MSKPTYRALSRSARLLCLAALCTALGSCGWLRNEFFIYDRVRPVETEAVPADSAEVFDGDAGRAR